MLSRSVDQNGAVAAVIGDLVRSRQHGDQSALFATVRRTLEDVNRHVQAIQPLQMTIGDEFQAVYSTVAIALDASLMLRLKLAEDCDVRFGVGWGEISVYDRDVAPMAQSGTSWWNAREALDESTKDATRSGWPRGLRTRVRGLPPGESATINAFLLCRDQLLSAMDARASEATLGLMLGQRQLDTAKKLGISQPAVSKRLRESGAFAIIHAHRLLNEGLP